MPISKPDHVQVHRLEFAKGTNLPRLIDEVERSIQSARYATYGMVAVAGGAAIGLGYGLYKIGQAIGDAWEDFSWRGVTTKFSDTVIFWRHKHTPEQEADFEAWREQNPGKSPFAYLREKAREEAARKAAESSQ